MACGEKLRHLCANEYVVCRFNSDEFCQITVGTNLAAATALALSYPENLCYPSLIRHQAIVLGSFIIFRQLKFPAKPA